MTREIKRNSKECKDKRMEGKCQIVEGSANNHNSHSLFRTANEICGVYNAKLVCVYDIVNQTLLRKNKFKTNGQNTIRNYTANKILLMILFSENYQLPMQQNTR